MHELALLATMKAKEGKEDKVKEFLAGAVEMARAESGTLSWFALQMDESTFGIFDTFAGEEGREAHLNGDTAKKLMESAEELLSESPVIQKVTVLAAK